MNEEFDSREAYLEGLKGAVEYIDTLGVLTEKEKKILKENVQYPGIHERVLEIKYISEESDPKAPHRASILLEALRNDIKDFPH
jgi:hypothetical protein